MDCRGDSRETEQGIKYILQCVCGSECPCRRQDNSTHLNLVRRHIGDSVNAPPQEELEIKWINVRGREEHEAIISNADWCKELGLDQQYEIMVYLKRWGEWLNE